jgi:hypothetical protein
MQMLFPVRFDKIYRSFLPNSKKKKSSRILKEYCYKIIAVDELVLHLIIYNLCTLESWDRGVGGQINS